MSRVPPLEITPPQRRELERRLRAHTTTQRTLRRARVILLAADGVANRQIATQVGIDEKGVATWRRRFAAQGLTGLEDRRRPGRPRIYDHDDRLKIVATVTTQRPEVDSPGRPGWSPNGSPMRSASPRRRSGGSWPTLTSSPTRSGLAQPPRRSQLLRACRRRVWPVPERARERPGAQRG